LLSASPSSPAFSLRGRRGPSHGLLIALICSLASPILAEHEGPWNRHTIDNGSRGADGVRLGDINGDGLQDIVTGWEEGGIVRLYLNPGPEKAKDKWPAVTVGPAKNVEDAVLVDLDNDGTMDVVSSCEGKTKTMFVHWGPEDKTKLLDEDAWVTEPIPATAGKQMWMYCLPKGPRRSDGAFVLHVGSKGKDAAFGSLISGENPRDLDEWTYLRFSDVGWIMSIQHYRNEAFDYDFVLMTDRRGPTRGVYRISDHDLEPDEIQQDEAEYMFAHAVPHPNDDLYTLIAVATRNGFVQLYDDLQSQRSFGAPIHVPNPFGVKQGKAVAIGRLDKDQHSDLVVSFNTQSQKDKPGVVWIKVLPDKDPKDWPAYDISGLKGKKFDRIELIDLDGDGDLDVLTCEEADNLGVIWYENPYGVKLTKP